MNTQIKILIIERHEPFRDSLAELLTLENYRVFQARTGHQGLKLVSEMMPDLVICARSFFDCSCWQILQELRKDAVTRDLPFIFLSSKPAGEQHEKMTGQKAVFILIKPFSMEELLMTIRESLIPKTADVTNDNTLKLRAWNELKTAS